MDDGYRQMHDELHIQAEVRDWHYLKHMKVLLMI